MEETNREKDGPKCTRVENSNFFTNPNLQGTFILSRLFCEIHRMNVSLICIITIITNQRYETTP